MESDPTRINELLVGLGAEMEVVSVGDEPGRPLRVHVRLRVRETGARVLRRAGVVEVSRVKLLAQSRAGLV